ncbi:imidazolonepropionase [Aquabacterium sp. OR-4]|uniref:imidazolonepropionase n=1 Tax=Aquabacterium sp. OR-4 TaxID=2978127 RepID=UPI0028CA139E|nr:imidazolonepropionase [Aquabacterium sp. OR-4]MDT7839013.1 imidazolonepropionase [Aquabacterium sp. OR-4]
MNTPAPLTLWQHAHLATMDGATPYGWQPDGALLTQGDTLRWVGALAELPAALRPRIGHEISLGGRLVTPGLIDAHTHLVYAGDRALEFEQRLQGASYEQIARAGGGIRSTVAATRAADEQRLLALALGRARQLLAEGVTTLEIKSGYGLDAATEARCLRVARGVGQALGITVRTTSLGAHALPPEFDGRPDDYIAAVAAWLPAQAADGLVDAVDAFCDTIGFTPEQTRRVFDAAQALGLPVKLHAEQLSNQEGAALAAGYGALSCDHIEHLSDRGIAAMAGAGTVAMLLPTAFYFLRDTRLPPVQALRQAGVPMAVASDHNPGSSPGLSLLLAMNMACTLFRLTPEEALAGTTVHAARALGLQATHGRLAAGCRADFVAWNLNHPAELAYWFGQRPAQRVVAGGRTVHLAGEAGTTGATGTTCTTDTDAHPPETAP